MTPRWSVILLALFAVCTAVADPTSSPDSTLLLRGQRQLEGPAWPRGMTFQIIDPDALQSGPPPELRASETNGDARSPSSFRGSSRRGGGASVSKSTPARALLKPTPQVIAAVERRRQLTELDLAVSQLRGAALDLGKLKAARSTKAELLPILMFLVERGVLTAAEKDAAFDELDTDDLLERIAECAARLASERDRACVQLYLAGETRPPARSK